MGLTVAAVSYDPAFVYVISSLFIIETLRNLFDYFKHKDDRIALSQMSIQLSIKSERYRVESEKLAKKFEMAKIYQETAELELRNWLQYASERADLGIETEVALRVGKNLICPEVVSYSMSARHTLTVDKMTLDQTGEVSTNSVDLETEDDGGDDVDR